MWTQYHPAPGTLGELMPGSFVVPQNPIYDNKSRALDPMGFVGVRYIPSMGEILPSRFTVPRNALVSQIREGLAGCCCSDGTDAPDPDNGTGFLNGAPLMSMDGLKSAFGDINWITVGVAVAAAMALSKK